VAKEVIPASSRSPVYTLAALAAANQNPTVREVGRHDGKMMLCTYVDGDTIACGGASGTVKIYNRNDRLDLKTEFRACGRCRWRCGQVVADRCQQGAIRATCAGSALTSRLWCLAAPTIPGTSSLCLSRFLSGTDVGCAGSIVWDWSGQQLHRFSDHSDEINCLFFDAQRLATASDDKTVRVYDLPTYRAAHVLDGQHER
jgi:WD40 repeat protein